MDLEDGRGCIDMLSQVDLFDQLHDDTDTAAMNRLLFFGEFKFCSRGPNHWRAKDTFSLVDSGTKFSVAFAQLLAYFVVHSKPFVGGCELKSS